MADKFDPTQEQWDTEMAEARRIIGEDLVKQMRSGAKLPDPDPNPGGPPPPGKKADGGTGSVGGGGKRKSLWWGEIDE